VLATTLTTLAVDALALVILYTLLRFDRVMENTRKRAFSFGIGLIIIAIIAEAGTLIALQGDANFVIIHIIFNVFGFSLVPFIPLAFIMVFDSLPTRKYKFVFIPSFINVLITALSPIYKFIFYVDANNSYQRGNFFFIFVVAYMINIFLFIYVAWKKTKSEFYPIKWKIFYMAILLIGGVSIQVIFPNIHSSWHVVTLTVLVFYIILFDFEGNFDALTRLYNRSAFEKEIIKLENKSNYSIVLLDINKFKLVNDTFGHDYGDLVLIEMADAIRAIFSQSTKYFRIGGDEFCIIIHCSEKTKLEERLLLLHETLETKRLIDVEFPTLAYGYGICSSAHAANFKSAFKQADLCMYKNKNSPDKLVL